MEVFTLLVEVGRKPGDGLPLGATGAGVLCYAAGADQAEAVRAAMALLAAADFAPTNVVAYGTLSERLAAAGEVAEGERALMERARDENIVIVAEITPLFGANSVTPPRPARKRG